MSMSARVSSGLSSGASSKVAAVQMTSGAEVDANLAEAGRLVRAAAREGAGLVVLPESFALMSRDPWDQVMLGEPDGAGPLQSFLQDLAAEARVWLVGGTIPIVGPETGRVRSACLVFDEQGRRVARYDKLHLFDVTLPGTPEHYEESASFAPGERPVVIASPWGGLGLGICYDLRFPEVFRSMLEQGLSVLALPAAFTVATGRDHWETLLRARAIENLAFVIAAAQWGSHGNGRETFGHSLVLDPWGRVLDCLPEGAGLACADLDAAAQAALRERFPALSHRRLKCGH